MTDQELKDLVASLAVNFAVEHAKTEQAIQSLTENQRETDRQLKETDRQLRAQMKELSKQIGGLGNKFGSFTEGMAFPSMEKLLRKKLGMTTVVQRAKSNVNGEELEIDILAYANTDLNIAYIVEVKSHLKERDLDQVLKIMQQFPSAFPEHQNKAIYGIVATVDGSTEMKKRAIEAGLYVAIIHDEQFKLQVPKNFKPKNFQQVNNANCN